MITYYLDAATDPEHPRLVRRVNNGDPSTFDNTLGTAVAIDVVDLQFTYDISNGTGNPGNVEMTPTDLGTGGACSPDRLRGDADSQGQRDAHGRSRNAGSPSLTSFLTTRSSRRSVCAAWRSSIGTAEAFRTAIARGARHAMKTSLMKERIGNRAGHGPAGGDAGERADGRHVRGADGQTSGRMRRIATRARPMPRRTPASRS